MDMLLLGLALGFAAALILVGAFAFARAGSLGRAWSALGVAGQTSSTPAAVAPPPVPKIVVPPKPSGEALRVLALLQADSRFIDFFLETLPAKLTDDQVGGILDVHKKVAAALKKYLVIEPVFPGADGERVTVQKGFDPSAIRVLGNVTGEPPFTGELQHPGWKVRELKLPGTAEGQDPFILQPAEVQM